MRHLLSFRVMSASQLPPPCGEGDSGEARAAWGSCNIVVIARSAATRQSMAAARWIASLLRSPAIADQTRRAGSRPQVSLRDADRLSGEPRFDVLDRVHEILAVIVFRRVAEMRAQHDVFERAQDVVLRQRLDVVDVERGAADGLALHRVDERGFIDDRSARRIHENGIRLHQRELLRADEAACAVRQHEMNGDDVGAAKQLFLGDEFGAARGGFFRREVLAPGDSLHAEGLSDFGDRRAEFAEARKAERAIDKPHAERFLPARLDASSGLHRECCAPPRGSAPMSVRASSPPRGGCSCA